MLTVQEMEDIAADACGKVGLDFCIPIKLNGRLRRTYGQLCYKKNCPTLVPDRLEMSKIFVENAADDDVRQVLLHEVAHFVATVETGKRHGHDSYFKDACHRIGCTNDTATANFDKGVPKEKLYKYTVTCEKCGASNYYYRAGNVVKHPYLYNCQCGGKLIVKKNY